MRDAPPDTLRESDFLYSEEEKTGRHHTIPAEPSDAEKIALVIGQVFEDKFSAAFDAKFGPLSKLMESVLDTLMQVCATQTEQDRRISAQADEIASLREGLKALTGRVYNLESRCVCGTSE